MAKEIRLRLYRIQDYDLYTIYFDKNYRFGAICREVVNAYAERRPAPVIEVKEVSPLPKGRPISITTSFLLRDEDVKAQEMLNVLAKRGRNANNFVKHLIRRSLYGIENIYFDEGTKRDWPDLDVKDVSDQTQYMQDAKQIVPDKKKQDQPTKQNKQDKKPRREEKAPETSIENKPIIPEVPKDEKPIENDPLPDAAEPINPFSMIDSMMNNF